MGTSTHSGHYVAHIQKEGRWVIFNDSTYRKKVVGLSSMTAKKYFFQRIDG
ncbi:hypothetical protein AALP_AA3G238500 [Arabis alpina]|uniref:USP domain-containing protein n=1 Tax=Arabis alpina TaxID=50452 RepID=A0A087HB84_ARAAL|nr:hypothetical protein AALP_AA3G238500 [Arabis alpina]